MKNFILTLVCLAALSLGARGQESFALANSSTGTTASKLAKVVVNGGVPQAQITATTDTSGAVGIVAPDPNSGAGTSGQVIITRSGIAPCVFDNTTVAGDFVQIAAGTAGDCHDAGASRPTSGQIIGVVIQAGGSAGTYNVLLDKSILPSSGGTGGNLFGDGSDGAVTADGTTTLNCLGAPSGSVYIVTRDCYFTTLVVNSGVTIKTASNRILATGSITNSGTIQNSGNNGGGGGPATGTNKSTGGTSGSISAALATGSLPAPLAAIAGKTGANGGTGVGSNGTNGTAGNSSSFNITSTTGQAGVAGGAGGASGASGGNNAGGPGGTGGTGGAATQLDHFSPHEISVAKNLYDPAANPLQPGGGNGGAGSGASGGGDGTNAGGGGGGSGGPGGNGGFLVLASPTITLNGGSVINVSGGNGQNGGAGGTPTTGNCGGGGGGAGGDGGNGGIIVRIYSTLTNNGTDTVSGGTAGTGGALGTGVGTGTNGTAGTNGNAGAAGLVFNLQLS